MRFDVRRRPRRPVTLRRVSTHAPGPQAREDDARWRFGLFSGLLAVALLLHQLWWDGFEVASVHFVVVLAAFAALLRPTSVRRLVAMVALEVLAVARDMPGAGSHTLLVGVCGATVLVYTASVAVPARRLPEGGALFERIAPFLRLSLLVLYAAAALAKMNGGFFDPAVSCAAALAPRIAWFDPSLLDAGWLAWPAIYGTVLVEAALPALLCVRRTRLAGLALGTAFHLVLALAGNVPFSSLVLALYVAFLPAGVVSRAGAAVSRVSPAGATTAWVRRERRWVEPVAFALLTAAWALGAVAAEGSSPPGQGAIGDGTRLVVAAVVAGAAVLAVAVRRAPAWPVGAGVPRRRLGHPVLAVGIAVLVANALTPYLGLKTESSFTMFSNLQTEAGSWNHAFVPEAVRVFSPQDRLVTVTASDDPSLLRRTRHGTRMVRFELERYLRRNPGVHATFTPGPAAAVTSAGATPVEAVVDKVAKFRDVRAAGRRGC